MLYRDTQQPVIYPYSQNKSGYHQLRLLIWLALFIYYMVSHATKFSYFFRTLLLLQLYKEDLEIASYQIVSLMTLNSL